jgi:hypothetical protein
MSMRPTHCPRHPQLVKFTSDKSAAIQRTASANFTRPADTTTYAQGDLVANSTTAGSVTPLALTAARVSGGGGVIRKFRLIKSTASLTNAQFRVHLFNALPTVANGDNAAWGTPGALNYIDAFDVTMDQAFTDGAVGFGFPRHGPDVSFKLALRPGGLCADRVPGGGKLYARATPRFTSLQKFSRTRRQC